MLHECADHLEREAPGADHDRRAQLDDRNARVAQQATDLVAAAQVRRELLALVRRDRPGRRSAARPRRAPPRRSFSPPAGPAPRSSRPIPSSGPGSRPSRRRTGPRPGPRPIRHRPPRPPFARRPATPDARACEPGSGPDVRGPREPAAASRPRIRLHPSAAPGASELPSRISKPSVVLPWCRPSPRRR